MTNEEILEGNKLFAKFDNRLSFKNDKKNHAEWVGCISGEVGNAFMSHQLKYHKSWDWLMPISEKISRLPYIDLFSIITNCGSDIYFKNPKFLGTGINFLSSTADEVPLIDTVYSTALKFIEYYYAHLENPPTKL